MEYSDDFDDIPKLEVDTEHLFSLSYKNDIENMKAELEQLRIQVERPSLTEINKRTENEIKIINLTTKIEEREMREKERLKEKEIKRKEAIKKEIREKERHQFPTKEKERAIENFVNTTNKHNYNNQPKPKEIPITVNNQMGNPNNNEIGALVAQAEARGEARGEARERHKLALSLKRNGFSDADIIKLVGLSEAECVILLQE